MRWMRTPIEIMGSSIPVLRDTRSEGVCLLHLGSRCRIGGRGKAAVAVKCEKLALCIVAGRQAGRFQFISISILGLFCFPGSWFDG